MEAHELTTGLYTIRTVPSLQIVGRNIVEDDSYDPKGVFGQPLGVPVTDHTTFLLRYSGVGDTFYITCGRDRGRVVGMEGRVMAAFHEYEYESVGGGGMVVQDVFEDYGVGAAVRWAVRRQPQHGDDIYTIESESGYWGWVMPTEHPQYTPVVLRALAATATMPPMYTPNELWVIERVG